MNANEIIDRIKATTELKTLTAIAQFVGTDQGFLSKKKNRNEFSADWALKIANHYNLSTDWILTGIYPSANFDNQIAKDIDTWLSEMESNNEPWRRDAFTSDFIEAFPRFRRWRESKKMEEEIENNQSGLHKQEAA
ncbi:MAG: helix-turn-helix domain containing protein [Desulfotalea sp.]